MLKVFKFCWKLCKRLFLLCFVLCLLAVAAAGGYLYHQVVRVPAPEMTEAHISAILGQESPVFYSDGVTQFGILFEDVHRKYVKYEDIPQTFIKALLAAEDDQFFNHPGLDPAGIVRALVANFKAGRIVQGGSTITQQTAKNLFKRESRSYEAKFQEMIQALRLEHYFSKEKILEFYCNQFYVSGNGHGLSVAARYFFDKEPSELTLVESAFIAGSVKQPNYYNPFLEKNREDPLEAKRRAVSRVRYVLGQMRDKGLLSQEDFLSARTTDLDFSRGRLSYEPTSTMDLVKEGVASPALTRFLEEQGIFNLSTSGARIITTIDKPLQDKVQLALRRRLSQLDVRLRGYNRTQVQKEYAELEYQGDPEIVPGAFVFGTLAGSEGRSGLLKVNLAGDRVGYIASDGLDRLGKMTGGRGGLRGQLKTGDKVYVSVREATGPNGAPLLDLERYPKVEGGAIVLQEGAIRAMCGGMAHVHFNRATQASRSMGSTFKTFVYAAALQLGWSPTDMLENTARNFWFRRESYSPKGHGPALISMSWAGVDSANLASVWLLYHLTDKLNLDQIMELARRFDMAPRIENGREESPDDFGARMRRQFGLKPSRSVIDQAAYRAAIHNLKADFDFDGKSWEYEDLRKLPFSGGAAGSYLGLRGRLRQLDSYRTYLKNYRPPAPPPSPEPHEISPGYIFQLGDDLSNTVRPAAPPPPDTSHGCLYRMRGGGVAFTARPVNREGWSLITMTEAQRIFRGMGESLAQSRWRRVMLDGLVSVGSMELVERQMSEERKRLDMASLYSMDIFAETRDFKTMLGIQYLLHLARACGVDSRLEAVPSMALGSNVVTLSEMTRIYEAMVTGMRFDAADAGTGAHLVSADKDDRDGLSLIGRIITPDGREVYNRRARPVRVFDRRSAASIGSILQNVISFGTGKYAAEHARLRSPDKARDKELAALGLSLPLLGKTGTANDFRNAAFMGFVPTLAVDDNAVLSLDHGYALGVYVGFDQNQKMMMRGQNVTGARGALPAWTDIAQILLEQDGVGDRVDISDLKFGGLPLRYPDVGQLFLPADGGGRVQSGRPGLKQRNAPKGRFILDVGRQEKGKFEPQRNFLPFWRHQESRPLKGRAQQAAFGRGMERRRVSEN